MPINTPAVVSGELITSAWGNTVRADLIALGAELARDGAFLTRTAQSIPAATLTSITWTTETFDDNGNYHAPSAPTITFYKTAFYMVTARLVRESGNWTTGYMRFNFSSGGAFDFAGSGTSSQVGSMLVYASAGTTMTCQIYQNAGTVNVDGTLYVARMNLFA